MVARQSCHALRSPSDLAGVSNRSASSLIRMPSAFDDAWANRERKESMSWRAVRLPFLYREICARNVSIVLASLPARLDARSMTEAWWPSRTWSWASRGVAPWAPWGNAVSSIGPVEAWAAEGGRDDALGSGGPAGPATGASLVNCPPKVRGVAAPWTASCCCLWKASSSLLIGCAELAGKGSALGSRPRP